MAPPSWAQHLPPSHHICPTTLCSVTPTMLMSTFMASINLLFRDSLSVVGKVHIHHQFSDINCLKLIKGEEGLASERTLVHGKNTDINVLSNEKNCLDFFPPQENAMVSKNAWLVK